MNALKVRRFLFYFCAIVTFVSVWAACWSSHDEIKSLIAQAFLFLVVTFILGIVEFA